MRRRVGCAVCGLGEEFSGGGGGGGGGVSGRVFVRCDLCRRLGMWEAARNDREIGEAELRE